MNEWGLFPLWYGSKEERLEESEDNHIRILDNKKKSVVEVGHKEEIGQRITMIEIK